MNRSSPHQVDISYTEHMNSTNSTYGGFDEHFQNLVNLITIAIGLPLTLVLIIAVVQVSRRKHNSLDFIFYFLNIVFSSAQVGVLSFGEKET